MNCFRVRFQLTPFGLKPSTPAVKLNGSKARAGKESSLSKWLIVSS